MTGLVNNFYYEFQSNSGDLIEADQPVLVAQYTLSDNQCTGSNSNPYGDPEMIFLSPVEQGVKKAVFYSTRNQAIDLNFANIITASGAIASLRIDGAALSASEFIPHPVNNNYSVAVKRFIGPGAQHTITCDSSFIATAYGVGFVESYGYNVGTMVNNLNAVSSIRNSLSTASAPDSFTCPKSPFRLYINLAYRATQIHWKLSQAAGLFPGADSIVNNPVPLDSPIINGRKYYRYSLQQDFIFNTTGTYLIPFTYTAPDIDACNHTEQDVIKVIVKPGPISYFTVSTPSCITDSIYFTGAANANGFILNNYLWSFDDLSTQSSVNAVKKFSASGLQNVRYRVTAQNGCIGDTTKLVNIFDSPVAKFGVSLNTCQKDSVMFTDSSTISTGILSSWQWNFGDGTSITTTNNNPVFHQYNNPGIYTAYLIVNSGNGCKSDTAFRQVSILPAPNARFGFNRNICAGDSILLSDSSSIVSGNIISWQWNFGDGSTASLSNNNPFYHSYPLAGIYAVSLVAVADNSCASDTFRLNVNVANKPTASFSISGIACVDSVQHFTSSFPSGGTPAPDWYWDFGDGQIFNSNSSNAASHTYSSALTNITVKHVVNLGQGCVSDTAISIIPSINVNPIADFHIIVDTACVNKPVRFSSTISDIAVWNWNFGIGTGNNSPPFLRSYASAGNYNISLRVISNAGCSSVPVTKSVNIFPNPLVNAGPDKFIVPGGSVLLDASNATTGNFNYTWSPATGLNSPSLLTPNASPAATTEYIITATDVVNKCTAADKVVVNVISGLYIPNAFTPNKDGINDSWKIPGLAVYPGADVMIYNRFGELIYNTKDYYNHPWNGTYKGREQPTSTFVYLVKLNDPARQILKGTVTLIR
jgi:gliding motility-associated-like protein